MRNRQVNGHMEWIAKEFELVRDVERYGVSVSGYVLE